MRFKKALCMTTLATLLFPVVQNIEYVDAAEYSIDIVVDTVEIDINDIPEDRCVKVGISLYNNPGMSAIFFPLQKNYRLEYNDPIPLESNATITRRYHAENIDSFTIDMYNNEHYPDGILTQDGTICFIKIYLPQDVIIGDYFELNILNNYDGFTLCFYDKDDIYFLDDCFNVTNGGIRIVGAEPSQEVPPQTELPLTESPLTEPPQTEPPQTEPSQTEPPQTSTSSDTFTTIESTTITTTSITTTTNESTVTTTENTTNSMTSVTTTSFASSITTTTTTEASEVTENKNDKNKNKLPLILAILASIGILGGIIGFIIKKSKGHREK